MAKPKANKLNPVDISGQAVDVSKLTDMQSLLFEELKKVDLSAIQKHGGSYFVWACIPESQRIVLHSMLADNNAWKIFLNTINQHLLKTSEGKLELVVRAKE